MLKYIAIIVLCMVATIAVFQKMTNQNEKNINTINTQIQEEYKPTYEIEGVISKIKTTTETYEDINNTGLMILRQDVVATVHYITINNKEYKVYDSYWVNQRVNDKVRITGNKYGVLSIETINDRKEINHESTTSSKP